MPLPLAPIAGVALRYGAVALIGAMVAKRSMKTRDHKDAVREQSFNHIKDGLDLERVESEDEVQLEGTHGHWQRIWLGQRGIEFDSRILARLRIRKLTEKDRDEYP